MPPKRRVAKKPSTSRSGAGGGGGPRQKQKQIINLSIGKGGSASSQEYRPPTIVQVQDHYAHEAMPAYSERAATQAGDYLEMQRQNNAENLAERRQLMDRQFTHGLILTGISAAVKALPLIKAGFDNSGEALDAGRRLLGRAHSAVGAVRGMFQGNRDGQRLGGEPRQPAAVPPLGAAAAAAAASVGPQLGGAAPALSQSRVRSGGDGGTSSFYVPPANTVRPARSLRPENYDTWTSDEVRVFALRGHADAIRHRRAGGGSASGDKSD